MFTPQNSFCLYFHMFDLSPFFSNQQLNSIRNSNRNNMSQAELDSLYETLNQIPSQYQIMEKNEVKAPEELLVRLSKQNFMIGNLDLGEGWGTSEIVSEMKKMLAPDFLPFCSELGQFPGRMSFGVYRLKPFDEIEIIQYLKLKGPLLVFIQGDHIQKHKRDTVLYDIKSTDNFLWVFVFNMDSTC